MQQNFRHEELNDKPLPDLVSDDAEIEQSEIPTPKGLEFVAPVPIEQHTISAPQLSSSKTFDRNFLEIVIPTFVGLMLTLGTFFASAATRWNLFGALGLLSIIIVVRFHKKIALLTKLSYPVSSKAACVLHLLSMGVPITGLFLMAMPGYSPFLQGAAHDLSATGISGMPFMFPIVIPAFWFMFIWLQYVVFLCGKGNDKPGAGVWSLTVMITFLTLWASMNIDIHDFHQMQELLTNGISVYFSVFYSLLTACLLYLSYKPKEKLMQTSDALARETAALRAKSSRFTRFWLGLYP